MNLTQTLSQSAEICHKQTEKVPIHKKMIELCYINCIRGQREIKTSAPDKKRPINNFKIQRINKSSQKSKQVYKQQQKKMSKHKYCSNQSPNYQVKQRYIPTYVHEHIFEQAPLRPYSSRYTPTFQSTVFDTEGYNIKTVHSKNANQPVQPGQHVQVVVQSNQPIQKTASNYPAQQKKVFQATRDKWFDHTKEEMFGSIKDGQNRGYSRQRKHVDLSSDPVFTDFIYESKSLILRMPGQAPAINFVRQNAQIEPAHVNKNEPQIPRQLQSDFQQGKVISDRHQARSNKKQEANIQQVPRKYNKKTIMANNFQKHHQQSLKVKGKNAANRPQTAKKLKNVQQKPTFTVIRKNRVQGN